VGKLVIASRNTEKRAELAALLSDCGVEILTLDDFPNVPEVVEDGKTFAENARKKALAAAEATGLPAVADDSGLEVDALGGRPGVLSARYAGPDATDAQRVDKLLEEMRDVPESERGARFRCAIAYATPNGVVAFTVEGSCEGRITTEPCGSNGFGYDPVFFHPESGCTFAELAPEQKNRVSHRARGLAAFRRRFDGRPSSGED